MKAAAFDYHRAASLDDAVKTLASADGAKVVAGGCSLGPMLNLRLARPPILVDLAGIDELRRLDLGRDGLTIGARWTHAEIEDGAIPDVTRGMMRKVAGGIAYRPVRNRGTIGGSLAHADPAADWLTAMTALDATLVIHGAGGQRNVAADAFTVGAFTTVLGDADIVAAVHVPRLSDRARWAYYKICRKTGEFAKAIGAVVADPERNFVRVVCGAVEAPPIVLVETSAAFADGGAGRAAEQAGAEIDRLLADHDAPFRQLHRVAVERALAEVS